MLSSPKYPSTNKKERSILFGSLHFVYTPLSGSNEPLILENTKIRVETCDVPPPDSFRVISRGPNFISVTWQPTAATNTHTITVLTKTDTTEWVLLGTFHNIPGSSYTVSSVPFDVECKLIIATNCPDGQPSTQTKSCIDKIILELTTGGRRPYNPKPISCTNILYNNWEWVGFLVLQEGTYAPSNMFEIKVIGDKIQIKRVFDPTVVYATLDDNTFPGLPKYPPNPFKLIKKIPNALIEDIGRLAVTKSGVSLDICQAASNPVWNNSFSFTVMKADAVYGFAPPPPFEYSDRSVRNPTPKIGKIKAQSPFKETLNIFVDQPNQVERNVSIRLLNTNNQIVLEQEVQTPFEQISLSAETIPPGIYVLRIETKDEVQSLKIVKIE